MLPALLSGTHARGQAVKARPGFLARAFALVNLMLLAAVLAASLHDPAIAGGPPTTETILSATQSGDASVRLFSDTLGGFFTSPLTSAGTATTLLGGLFLIFNGFVFLCAVLWGTWNVVRGVVTSAHEGQVLGKNMSAVWMPIRMGVGLVGVVPAFGGFGIAQVAFVGASLLGIGVANLMTQSAVNLANTGVASSVWTPTISSPSGTGSGTEQIASVLFASHLCKLAHDDVTSQLPVTTNFEKVVVVKVNDAAASRYWLDIGTPSLVGLCGNVTLEMASPNSHAGGFSTNAVNYEGIKNAIKTAYVGAVPLLSTEIETSARNWYTAWKESMQQGTSAPDYPLAEVKAADANFHTRVQAGMASAMSGVNSGAISDAARSKITEKGWIGIGAWYSTFAEVNTAIGDATKAVNVKLSGVNALKVQSLVAQKDWVETVMSAYSQSVARTATRSASSTAFPQTEDSAQGNDLWKKIIDYVTEKHCDMYTLGMSGGSATTATGNVSLGQCIVNRLINNAAGSTGGGTDVNPIIAMKNMGDYLVTFAETIGVAVQAANAFENSGVGWFTKLTAGSTFIGAVAIGFAKWLVLTLGTISEILLYLGLAMAVYLPMIPFITWWGGVVSYCVTIIEGLAAMAIGSLAHMDADGEGMGQRAERGYLFLLNAAMRPALMVIGFFAAMALLNKLGTLLLELYGPVIANVQGNSVTGLFSIIGFILIFFVLNYMLIQSLFNMIFLIPDQVLGIIGVGQSTNLGKDTESGGRTVLAGFQRHMGGGMRTPKEPPGGGGGGTPDPTKKGSPSMPSGGGTPSMPGAK